MNLTDQIFNTIKSRKYNHYPSFNSIAIKEIISNSLEIGTKIPSIGYWGAGQKENIDDSDIETINFLFEFNESIKKIYSPGVSFTFLLAYTHAKINGINPENYFNEFKQLLIQYNFSHELFLTDDSLKKVTSKWFQDKIPFSVIQRAKKHSRTNSELAANKYLAQRNHENILLEKDFNGYIFNTFSSPKDNFFLPNMPTLYLKSNKKGSHPPWYHS